MRFAPHLICLGLASSLAPLSCSSTSTTATTIVRPELVAVDPADFLGSVPCAAPEGPDAGPSSEPAAARSYVATLFDVTPLSDGSVPNPGTPLASSPPTSCLNPVMFTYVVAAHRYIAQVDAYVEALEDIAPISAGSRSMVGVVDGAPTGEPVLPRWAATCGGYPLSPYVEAGTSSDDAGPASAGAGGNTDDTQPPGVISYASITQTPHNCGPGLVSVNAK